VHRGGSGQQERLLSFADSRSEAERRRQPHLIAFDTSNETLIIKMVVALVFTFAAVFLGQLDAAAFIFVHGAHMRSIRAAPYAF
jgi:hypothetical protein